MLKDVPEEEEEGTAEKCREEEAAVADGRAPVEEEATGTPPPKD